MKIAEIFKSIQGETAYAGMPCVFIRFAGCNLRCSYCDTAYAQSNGMEMTVEKVLEKVGELNAELVVLTGGEPLVQKGEACRAAQELLAQDRTVLIETNGSLPLSGIPAGVIKIMDLKCPSSKMSGRNLLENIHLLGPNDSVKFALGSARDYDWAKKIIFEFSLSERCEVLLSPVWGVIPPEYVADRMLADGLKARLQVQLHKILWGDERGR